LRSEDIEGTEKMKVTSQIKGLRAFSYKI